MTARSTTAGVTESSTLENGETLTGEKSARSRSRKRVGAAGEPGTTGEPVGLPPMDRETDHAAESLLTLISDDAFDALVSASGDPEVRATAVAFMAALVRARGKKRAA